MMMPAYRQYQHSLACQYLRGSYLNDKDNNGIPRVIFAGIGALENASLLCGSGSGGSSSSSSFGGYSRRDCREYCAYHAVRLFKTRTLEDLGCPGKLMSREKQLERGPAAM